MESSSHHNTRFYLVIMLIKYRKTHIRPQGSIIIEEINMLRINNRCIGHLVLFFFKINTKVSSREMTLGLWKFKSHIQRSTSFSSHVKSEADIYHNKIRQKWLQTYSATIAFFSKKSHSLSGITRGLEYSLSVHHDRTCGLSGCLSNLQAIVLSIICSH